MEMIASLSPFILMFVLFYFLLIRPNQKRQKAVRTMQESLQKGDKIVTIGGLHAIVDAVDEGTVIVKCGDGTRLTYDRSAIRDIANSAK